MSDCSCQSGDDYDACCGRLHRSGAGLGTTAEQLMRARYSAYVLHNEKFLLATWHSTTCPSRVEFDDGLEWLGLEIISTTGGSPFESDGTVEFRARFRRGSENLELHEVSTFERLDSRWVYLTGE